MSTFSQLWRELLGQVKQLDVFAAQKFINRAYADICQAHSWSFLQAVGYIAAVDEITTGTVSVTEGVTAIQFDVDAAAVLDAVGVNVPVTQRQIRVAGGLPFPLASYTPGGAAVLEQAFQGTTDSAASYSVLRCYYTPPATDFFRFQSVVDPVDEFDIWLHFTQQELNAMDPSRANTGQPCVLASLDVDPNGLPRYEFWPHPTAARAYQCSYEKRGTDFTSDDDEIPSALRVETILWKAKVLVYEWAAANQNSSPSLMNIPWLSMSDRAQLHYQAALKDDKRSDRDTFQNRLVIPQRGRRIYPADANWLQNHEPGNALDYYGGL
jgi:hypothetical protein